MDLGKASRLLSARFKLRKHWNLKQQNRQYETNEGQSESFAKLPSGIASEKDILVQRYLSVYSQIIPLYMSQIFDDSVSTY